MPELDLTNLGLVSNCWNVQLASGESLRELVDQAVRFGFRVVELRQGSLGEFETAVAEAAGSEAARETLAGLPRRFPDVRFNLAVSLPCFDGQLRDDDPRVTAALAAAVALADGGRPHLRLVDIQSRGALPESAVTHAAGLIGRMAFELVAVGGRLSIELARQTWPEFWSAIRLARTSLGCRASQLQCCFDPCNLLLTADASAVPSVVDSVTAEDLSMVHLKQRRDGQIQPVLSAGDLDWPRLLKSFARHGYRGPWLFEVAPDAGLWENLHRSVDFLRSIQPVLSCDEGHAIRR